VDSESQPSSTGLDPNLAGLLTYVLGFISGLVFLVVEKKSAYVRFHAYQSTIAFLALSITSFILGFIPVIGALLGSALSLASLALWVVLMIKAFQGERFKLPILGDMAEERAGQ
jgi:uncharacterized membrane protein